MKQLHLTIITLLCISSAACAQSGPRVAGAASSGGQNSAVASTARGTFDRMVHNANDCIPGHADPVWGAGTAPLGYTCSSDSANGN